MIGKYTIIKKKPINVYTVICQARYESQDFALNCCVQDHARTFSNEFDIQTGWNIPESKYLLMRPMIEHFEIQIDSEQFPTLIVSVMPLKYGEDLFSYSLPNKPQQNEIILRVVMKQIALAIDILHSYNCIHGAVKPENVMVMELVNDDDLTLPLVKLGNFDFTTPQIQKSSFPVPIGTTQFWPPEVFIENRQRMFILKNVEFLSLFKDFFVLWKVRNSNFSHTNLTSR